MRRLLWWVTVAVIFVLSDTVMVLLYHSSERERKINQTHDLYDDTPPIEEWIKEPTNEPQPGR